MRKVAYIIVLSIPMYLAFLLVSGLSVPLLDLILGYIISLAVSALVYEVLVREHKKLLQLHRLAYLVKYFFRYITVIEFRAHSDVIKRIFSPKMPINPGIVKVPYHVVSDYALTTIANSITNTPGTVVVDVDEEEKKLFVHWIDVKGIEEELCYEKISKEFEEYAKKIFD